MKKKLKKLTLDSKEKPEWIFRVDDIEKSVEKLIAKYRDKDLTVGTRVVTTMSGEDLPEEGFFLMLMSRRGDKITLRQFGSSITVEMIVQGFASVVEDICKNKDNKTVGIA